MGEGRRRVLAFAAALLVFLSALLLFDVETYEAALMYLDPLMQMLRGAVFDVGEDLSWEHGRLLQKNPPSAVLEERVRVSRALVEKNKAEQAQNICSEYRGRSAFDYYVGAHLFNYIFVHFLLRMYSLLNTFAGM